MSDATVKLEIWDTAGQERYHSLAPMYYRGASAAIIAYDITNTVTINKPFLMDTVGLIGWLEIVCLLIDGDECMITSL